MTVLSRLKSSLSLLAIVSSANSFDNSSDYFKAFRLYCIAASLGSAEAEYKIASYYDNGYAVAINHEKSFKWYLRAAEKRYPDAVGDVSIAYLGGEGVDVDYAKAKEYAVKGASLGSSSAMVTMGRLCEFGRTVPQSYEKAHEWYLKAADAGNQAGAFNAATDFLTGRGTQQDYEAAFKYNVAALQGINMEITGKAEYNLSMQYAQGDGTSRNFKNAVDYFKLACWNENESACQLAIALGLGDIDDVDALTAESFCLLLTGEYLSDLNRSDNNDDDDDSDDDEYYDDVENDSDDDYQDSEQYYSSDYSSIIDCGDGYYDEDTGVYTEK